MKKIFASSLTLEVGRKCNMNCAHCLRGPAEDVSMTFETAKKAIDSVCGIDTITFTGGEPMLYADFICKVIDYIMDIDKDVRGFYIASNGKEVNMKLMLKLAEFYAYIEKKSGEAEYTCMFDISLDSYHAPISEYNRAILQAFRFVGTKNNDAYLIAEGNAADNGLGIRGPRIDASFSVYDDMVDMVYVNALGYVLPDCDYSYETQRELPGYNIHNHTLSYIIAHYNPDESVDNVA